MRQLCTAILLATQAGFAAGAEGSLGRLFFTQAQRLQLEYRRQLADDPATGAIAVRGLVRRTADRSTLWVNGVPLYLRSANMSVSDVPGDPGRIGLRLSGRPPIRLRLGEGSRREGGP